MAVICIDFDGTVVTHDYPRIGQDIGAVPVLKALVEKGHKIILHTMRDNELHVNPSGGVVYEGCLQDAINWYAQNEIPLYGVNYNPDQQRWTKSDKVFGNLYIDDSALGSLMVNGHINWLDVLACLHGKGYITEDQFKRIMDDKEWLAKVSFLSQESPTNKIR